MGRGAGAAARPARRAPRAPRALRARRHAAHSTNGHLVAARRSLPPDLATFRECRARRTGRAIVEGHAGTRTSLASISYRSIHIYDVIEIVFITKVVNEPRLPYYVVVNVILGPRRAA